MPKLIYKKKIYNGNITLNDVIDDTATSASKTFSSVKISSVYSTAEKKTIQASVDLNTVVDDGVYWTTTDAVANGCTNRPKSGSNIYTFELSVYQKDSYSIIFQRLKCIYGEYFREKHSGTWSAWSTVITKDDSGLTNGKIEMPSNLYGESNAPLHMHNSDIAGLNALFFNDSCQYGEGLVWPRSSGNPDYLRVLDGQLYLGNSSSSEKNIRAIKTAEYQISSTSCTAFSQLNVELSSFGSGITDSNVIGFTVVYWTGVPFIASGDYGSTAGSSGLKCILMPLKSGTGWCRVRCTYAV